MAAYSVVSSFAKLLFIGILGAQLTSCAGRTACVTGGDTSWDWDKIHEDDHRTAACNRKKREDGTVVLVGRYTETFNNGKLALEGTFYDGLKEGLWTEYDPKGTVVKNRVFTRGREIAAPPGMKLPGDVHTAPAPTEEEALAPSKGLGTPQGAPR